MNNQKPKYHTWIRKKKIAIFSLVLVVLVVASFLLRHYWIVSLVLLAMAIPFAYIVYVLTYTYYQFSSAGGDYQAKIHDLIVSHIATQEGKLLDIGTGSGLLTIKAVKKLPHIKATGIDYWGSDWDYSKKLCEENARIEGVAE